MTIRFFAIIATILLAPQVIFAASSLTQEEALFQRVLNGTKCEQIPNNGRYCKY